MQDALGCWPALEEVRRFGDRYVTLRGLVVLDGGDGKLIDSAFQSFIVLPAVTTREVSYDGVS
jgi:hypothetical protein